MMPTFNNLWEEGDVDQKHQIFPPRSSFRIALARADAPTPKYPATPAIEISISGFKRKVNISIDGFEQRPLLHVVRQDAKVEILKAMVDQIYTVNRR
jgi:hypothetical protein